MDLNFIRDSLAAAEADSLDFKLVQVGTPLFFDFYVGLYKERSLVRESKASIYVRDDLACEYDVQPIFENIAGFTLPEAYAKDITHNYLNWILTPQSIQEVKCLQAAVAAINSVRSYEEFEDSFRRIGAHPYKVMKPFVNAVWRLTDNEPELRAYCDALDDPLGLGTLEGTVGAYAEQKSIPLLYHLAEQK